MSGRLELVRIVQVNSRMRRKIVQPARHALGLVNWSQLIAVSAALIFLIPPHPDWLSVDTPCLLRSVANRATPLGPEPPAPANAEELWAIVFGLVFPPSPIIWRGLWPHAQGAGCGRHTSRGGKVWVQT